MSNEELSNSKKNNALTISKEFKTKSDVFKTLLGQKSPETIEEKKVIDPWQDFSGDLKSIPELKKACERWGGAEWDKYIAFLDGKSEEVRETVLPAEDFDFWSNCSYAEALSILFRKDKYAHLKGKMDEFLQALSQQQQLIVRLRYWDNLRWEDVSQASGLKVGTAQVYLRRAEEKLRELFSDYEEEIRARIEELQKAAKKIEKNEKKISHDSSGMQ